MPTCKNCGSRLSKFDKDICPVCGTKKPLDGVSSETDEITGVIKTNPNIEYKPRKKITTFLLFIFVGFLGSGYFYLKFIKKGIIWLLINLLLIACSFSLCYFLVFKNDVSIAILVPLFLVYLLNLLVGLNILRTHDLKDGEGEFVH